MYSPRNSDVSFTCFKKCCGESNNVMAWFRDESGGNTGLKHYAYLRGMILDFMWLSLAKLHIPVSDVCYGPHNEEKKMVSVHPSSQTRAVLVYKRHSTVSPLRANVDLVGVNAATS
jgi:hypothetical protein